MPVVDSLSICDRALVVITAAKDIEAGSLGGNTTNQTNVTVREGVREVCALNSSLPIESVRQG